MRTKILMVIYLCFTAASFGQSKYEKDFLYYWQTINDNFAYFGKQKVNWEKVKSIYQPAVDTIKTEDDFIHLLETANNELYNGHIFLNRNTNSSNRLIPTGADLKVTFQNNKFVISEIRPGFNAELCGLSPGMIITKFNDIPIAAAVSKLMPRSAVILENRMYEYAANLLLAGTHDKKRKITVLVDGMEKIFYPDAIPNKTENSYTTLLEAKILPQNIGYIKINNSLGSADLIAKFDKAIDSLINTNGLILDLRETPSGGTTTVARAIMGRFINKELPYQKHIYTSEETKTGIKRSTLELVSPRPPVYKKSLIVLVNYWTGSMGEGMAIGFKGMHRAIIMGTKMAGLLGEIFSFETPELKIPFSIPCVQLQSIEGQPREDFIPEYLITNPKKILASAVKLLLKGKDLNFN